MICTKCGRDCTVRRATTPAAQKIWANVARAAESCPPWVLDRVEKAVARERETFLCKTCKQV